MDGGRVNIVIVGDDNVGKTSLVMTYVGSAFPTEYRPSVYDCITTHINMGGNEMYQLTLWDTIGSSEYDRLRPLVYPNADMIFICYSISSRSSFENIKTKWIPEINYHRPNIPIRIIALKADLRNPITSTSATQETSHQSDNHPVVSKEEGEELAKELHAEFTELSAKTLSNLIEPFELAVRKIHLIPPYGHIVPKLESNSYCNLLIVSK